MVDTNRVTLSETLVDGDGLPGAKIDYVADETCGPCVDGDCVAVGFTWVGNSTTGDFDRMGTKP